MQFRLPKFMNIFWERNKANENWYLLQNENAWGLEGSNLEIAQNHPILTPAILFIAKIFSQAEFYMEDVKTGEKLYDHKVLELLNNPNYYQTKDDLLEALLFMQIANGVAVLYRKPIIGLDDEYDTVYLLDFEKITFPDEFYTPLSVKGDDNPIRNRRVIYDKGGQNLKINLRDLLFFYDLPNALDSKQIFENKSRLDGLRQTLINTHDSLVAKNIILKSNGKEMISGSKDGFPLDDDEKRDAEALFNVGYGLGKSRKRGLITKANVNWQSLHIALRDLGLDESIKVDGNIIFSALHIPKDILSLEAKKTTYNNFKESMVSYIQNEIQSTLNSFCAVINKAMPDKQYKLRGDFENMPVMQFVRLERYDSVKKQAEALQLLRNAGVPDEVALEMCGMPNDLELGEMINPLQNQNEQSGNQSGEEGKTGQSYKGPRKVS